MSATGTRSGGQRARSTHAGGGVVESHQEVDHRGLAAAGLANECDRGAAIDLEADAVEYLLFWAHLVAEGDILELEVAEDILALQLRTATAARRSQRQPDSAMRSGLLFDSHLEACVEIDIWQCVEHLEDSLSRAACRGELDHEVVQRPIRAADHVPVQLCAGRRRQPQRRGGRRCLRSVSSRKVMSMPTVSGPWLSTTIPPYLTKPVAAERAPTPTPPAAGAGAARSGRRVTRG